MRKQGMARKIWEFVLCVLGCVLFIACMAGKAMAMDWNIGFSGSSNGLEGYYISIGEYYDVPHDDVVSIHHHGIPDEELPVVFYVARQARVQPDVIMRMRLDGRSWIDITYFFGLRPVIYYVPVSYYADRRCPYDHAYGHYKTVRNQSDWNRIQLCDADIVNQVNLMFISGHYHYEPREVMRCREQGRQFPAINRDIYKEHADQRYKYTGKPFGVKGQPEKQGPRVGSERQHKQTPQRDMVRDQDRNTRKHSHNEQTPAQYRGKQDTTRGRNGDRGTHASMPAQNNRSHGTNHNQDIQQQQKVLQQTGGPQIQRGWK